jgi:hypothetical protein
MLMTHIDRWLAARRASGFALEGYERHQHQFAEFAATRGDDHIRAETAVAWASPGSGEDASIEALSAQSTDVRFSPK